MPENQIQKIGVVTKFDLDHISTDGRTITLHGKAQIREEIHGVEVEEEVPRVENQIPKLSHS